MDIFDTTLVAGFFSVTLFCMFWALLAQVRFERRLKEIGKESWDIQASSLVDRIFWSQYRFHRFIKNNKHSEYDDKILNKQATQIVISYKLHKAALVAVVLVMLARIVLVIFYDA